MEQRAITLEQIRQAIRYPDSTMPALPAPRKRVMKQLSKKTLDVIFVTRDSYNYLIITAAWLKDEDRKHVN